MLKLILKTSRFIKPYISNGVTWRSFQTSAKQNTKVCVIGAGGGIGYPLSLLLKYQPRITELDLVDICDISGMGADLSHIDTQAKVSTHDYADIATALDRAEITVIVAGVPRKPGMTRDDLFRVNADIVGDIIRKISESKLNTHVAIVTNPINSIVPFALNLFAMLHPDKSLGRLTQKFCGVTCLDCVRANMFYAQHLGISPTEVTVPVVGGHSESTIVPLLSQSNHPCTDEEVIIKIVRQVREAGTRIVEAKKGAGSATLSMAYAANRFVQTLLDAYNGMMSYECAYGPSQVKPDVSFFAEMCVFTNEGCSNVISFDNITDYENKIIDQVLPILSKDIEKGIEYSREFYKNGPKSNK